MKSFLEEKVLVLNQDYEPLSISNVKRAVILIFLNKAECIVKKDGKVIRAEKIEFPVPSVIRILKYINYRTQEVPLNRKNILKRDNYQCQYCGTKEAPMTVDHVIPKTRGGKDEWTNLVCACVKCNNKKGDRTLKEAGMKLLKKPRKPTRFHLMFANGKIPDVNWKKFLFLD
uniref:HNH endonuclease n=1 Tax=candidate division WOR-3 bacterium TaxID=2052148 RepID=A0A7V4E329_UNCW3